MIFKYPDTNSSRANIEILNEKFHNQKIAIIGLGGTGSYLLDFIAKTPVSEVHIYDGDIFQLHNAFRSPGAISADRMKQEEEIRKVNYYFETYSRMHRGIIPHAEYISEKNIGQLVNMNFIFISVDKNKVRSFIAKKLISLKVPFIDVGMGINIADSSLLGSIRMTHFSTNKHDHLNKRIGESEFDENEYATNIQIAELNCLNAILAIIKWKKTIGFYQDLKSEYNSLFFLNTNKLLNEDNCS